LRGRFDHSRRTGDQFWPKKHDNEGGRKADDSRGYEKRQRAPEC
jgi:hypothetical protein